MKNIPINPGSNVYPQSVYLGQQAPTIYVLSKHKPT